MARFHMPMMAVLIAMVFSVGAANASRLVEAAREQTLSTAVYDGTYMRIAYPITGHYRYRVQ